MVDFFTEAAALAALAILPTYSIDYSGAFSYNSQFETRLYDTGREKFCSLTTGLGTTSNGIDYRFAISFGDRNEVRLATETPLPSLKSLTIEFPDGAQLELLDVKHTRTDSSSIAYVQTSSGMMSKILREIKAGGGTVSLNLQFGSPVIELPAKMRDAAYEGVKACERARLGQVAPD